jgi:parvulin-like peptidyl-prolyl isomerase
MARFRVWMLIAGLSGCAGVAGVQAPKTGSTTAAPPLPDAPLDIGPPVAKVGDNGVIGANEFLEAASRKVREQGGDLSPEQRKALVDELAQEEALWQEAAREGLYRDPKVRKIMVALLMRRQVYSKVRPSDFPDADLRAYFDSHQDEFNVPEKVQIKRIFVAVDQNRSDADALARAREVHEKVLARPADFKDLAAEYSDDTWKRRGGDLGYVARGAEIGVDPAVIDKAFSMQIGNVSEPFLAGGGYNVILAAAHRDPVQRTFEQSKGTVLRTMKNVKTKEMLDVYVASVAAQYPVTVDEKALDALDLTNLPRVPNDNLDEEVGPAGASPDARE